MIEKGKKKTTLKKIGIELGLDQIVCPKCGFVFSGLNILNRIQEIIIERLCNNENVTFRNFGKFVLQYRKVPKWLGGGYTNKILFLPINKVKYKVKWESLKNKEKENKLTD